MKAILIDINDHRREIEIPNHYIGAIVLPNKDTSGNPIVHATLPALKVFTFVGETDVGMNRPGTPIFRETFYHSEEKSLRYKNH